MRDLEKKRQRDREAYARRLAAGIKRVPDSVRQANWTPEQIERQRERWRRKEAWKRALVIVRQLAATPDPITGIRKAGDLIEQQDIAFQPVDLDWWTRREDTA